MAVKHKKIELNDWVEKMRLNTTHGDDMALYLLCQMYNKHAYVHTARYGWSTLPFKTETPFMEIAAKCDIELVLLHCWSFGEVLKIRRPMLPSKSNDNKTSSENNEANEKVRNPDDNTPVMPRNTDPHSVTPVNAADSGANKKLVSCTVSVERLSEPTSINVKEPTGKSADQSVSAIKSGYSMRVRQTPKKVTHCTSGRKRQPIRHKYRPTIPT